MQNTRKKNNGNDATHVIFYNTLDKSINLTNVIHELNIQQEHVKRVCIKKQDSKCQKREKFSNTFDKTKRKNASNSICN